MNSIESKGCEIVPHYKFSKQKIEDMYQTTYLKGIKDDISYENHYKREIVRDFKENFLSINEEAVSVSS